MPPTHRRIAQPHLKLPGTDLVLGTLHSRATLPRLSLSLALSLTPIMSGTIRGLVVLIESTLEHDAACHTLEAQCASLQAQVDAARAHVLEEKTTQRQLRTEIVGFLKERSESRSASEYSLLFPPWTSGAA